MKIISKFLMKDNFVFVISCIVCLALISTIPTAFAAGAVFDNDEYTIHDRVNIIIQDQNKNTSPGIPEVFSLIITSDSNPDGFTAIAAETEKDSGFFVVGVELTKDDNNKRKLHVKIGDTIYLNYEDFSDTAKIIGTPIDCGSDYITLDDLNCVSKASVGFDSDYGLQVKTFQTKYYRGDVIHIYGLATHDPDPTKKMSIKIIDSLFNSVQNYTVRPNVANQFKLEINTEDDIWDAVGDYTIKTEWMKQKSSIAFEIIQLIIPEEAVGKIIIMPNSDKPGCEITGDCFLPTKLETPVGDIITWVNADPKFDHVLVSGNEFNGPDGLFNSGELGMGDTFSFQFNQTGNYAYYDSSHPWMVGLIQVKEKHLVDNVPPIILLPGNMTVNADTESGVIVDFTVKAIDDVNGILEPNCTSKSGEFFTIGKTIVKCTIEDEEANFAFRSFTINVIGAKSYIPEWVKGVSGLWCDEEINDDSFIEAMQYLIDHEVIMVEIPRDSEEGAKEMPSWIKDTACWWTSGEISEDEFVNAIKFLISNGIVVV